MSALLRLCALCCLAACAFAETTIPSLTSQSVAFPRAIQDTCLRCNGAGTVEQEVVSGESTRPRGMPQTKMWRGSSVPLKRTCPRCHGKGKSWRATTAKEKIEAWRSTRRDFERALLTAGFVPIGAAYADRAELAALSPEAYARLAHDYPAYCKSCLGLKFTPCRRCKGTGHGKPAKDPALAFALPPPCDVCKGTGEEFCRTCQGSGLRPFCSRCSGTGVVDGRPKKGEEPFTERCRSCKGEGRR